MKWMKEIFWRNEAVGARGDFAGEAEGGAADGEAGGVRGGIFLTKEKL